MIKKIIEIIVNRNKSKSIKVDNSTNLQKAKTMQDKIFNDVLSDNVKLSNIPDAFQLLFGSDEKTKLQAAEVLNHVMSTLNSSQLVKLDKLFRERTSYDWNYDWRNKEPKELFHPSMSEEEMVAILGLSSFHPNGYFREKAIKALSNMETGLEIPYLLIRINDWVRVVRSFSKEVLLKFLTHEYAINFVNNLPLVLRLEECSRDEHMDIIDAVISMLSSDECSQKLIGGLGSNDPKVRLCCYKIILQRRISDNKSIVSYVMKDKNPHNRLFVLRSIQENIKPDEFAHILELLLKDKFSQIRIIALELLYKFNPKEAIGTLEKSLFDRNQSLRELSRYLLSKHKKYDFAAIYRESIEKNEQLYSSICGLGETGKSKDSKIVVEFLKSHTIQIVKASINVLARLDINGYKEELICALKDERAGVSKAARRGLYKEIDAMDGEDIYNIFKETTYEHAKINSCILLCTLSKWDAIRYIIEFCGDENESISLIGECAFESWKGRYNGSFTTPSKNQVEKIRRYLRDFSEFIKEDDKDFIEFAIRDFNK